MGNEVTPDSFGIASKLWPGLAKLGEEAAEVGQEIMKIVATGGVMEYGDGRTLNEDKLWDEVADLLAAIEFFGECNASTERAARIVARADLKLNTYRRWRVDEAKP